MKEKIVLDDIIFEMNKKFPEGLRDFEKARYLYIELGKKLSFNINYISERESKTQTAYLEAIDLNDIAKNEYTCRQISMIYAEALRRVGIEAEAISKPKTEEQKKISPEESLHKYTVVRLKDGRKFIADLVDDLAFIQKGLETLHFAREEEPLLDGICVIDKEEILNVDAKIGYAYPKDLNNSSQVYMDDFIQMVKHDMENEEHFKEYVAACYSKEEAANLKNVSMIKYKFDVIGRYFDTTSLGAREGKLFLERLLKEFFTEEEQKDISSYSLSTEHKEKFVPGLLGPTNLINCFVWKKGENDYEYYLYEQGKNLRQIDRDELNDFLKSEYYISKYDYKKIPGINYDDDGR